MTELTTLQIARDAVYVAFAAGWGTTTPYCFDNEHFTPPDPQPMGAQTADVAAWVRVCLRNEPSQQETLGTIGNRRFMRKACIYMQIFIPADSGTDLADQLAQKARAIFEGKTIGGVLCCYAGSPGEVTRDPRWYQVAVCVEAIYYEQK
jgi:hypothetical protein